jgi:hypothetical protein
MKRMKWNPRKVLIASAGVASVNYAVAAGCHDGGASLPCRSSQCSSGGVGGASVANLVAPFPVGDGGFSGATVANLVGPPPGGTPNLPDASVPDASAPDASPDDGGARDAAPDGAA